MSWRTTRGLVPAPRKPELDAHDCPACEPCPCCELGAVTPRLYELVVEESGRVRPLCKLCAGQGYVCDILIGEPSLAELMAHSD